MDLNELKKLINEEVQRTKQRNLLKEQDKEEKTSNLHAPNVQIRRASTGILPGGEEVTQLTPEQPVNPSYDPMSKEIKLDKLRKEAIPLLNDERINDPKLYKILSSIVNSNNIEDLKKNFLPLSKQGQTSYGSMDYATNTDPYAQELRRIKAEILSIQNKAEILARGSGRVERDPSKTGFLSGTDRLPSRPRPKRQEPTVVDPSGPTKITEPQPKPVDPNEPTKTGVRDWFRNKFGLEEEQ